MTTQGDAGDLALICYSQCFSRAAASSEGGSGKTHCDDIGISKLIDSTSTSFLRAAVVSILVPTAIIYFSGGASVGLQSPN